MKEINRAIVAEALRKGMPQLEVAVWDLEPFMKAFHNWKRNIVFVECEKGFVDELAEKLAAHFKGAAFYSGVKRLREREFAAEAAGASIVVLPRKDFRETEEDRETGTRIPPLEERAMSFLAFTIRKAIPVETSEALSVVSYFLGNNEASISKMHRFAGRRYIDWYLKLFLLKLLKKGAIKGVDPRYTTTARLYWDAIKEVEKFD